MTGPAAERGRLYRMVKEGGLLVYALRARLVERFASGGDVPTPEGIGRSGYASIREKASPSFRAIVRTLRLYARGATPISPNKEWEYPWVITNLALDGPTRILDAGCGKSTLDLYLAARGHDVHGIDSHVAERTGVDRYGYEGVCPRFARRHGLKVTYKANSIERIDYPDECFDRVICVSVIEHVRRHETINPRVTPLTDADMAMHLAMMQEMARILRPGGLLLVTTDYYPESLGFENDRLVKVDIRANIDVYRLVRESTLSLIGGEDLMDRLWGSPRFDPAALLRNSDIDWAWYANLLQTSVGLIFRKESR